MRTNRAWSSQMNVKAVVMEVPGSLVQKEYPQPSINDDTAVLDVALCGICGTDKHIYKNESKSHFLDLPTNFPIIPGHEIVGTIESIGKNASKRMGLLGERIFEGERVVPVVDLRCEECWNCKNYPGWPVCERGQTYGWGITSKNPPYLFGGFAQKMYLLPNILLAKVPDSVPDNIAVYAEVLSVGCTSFQRVLHSSNVYGEGSPIVGDVVIQGSGPLALAHVITARILGARNIIVVGKPSYRTEYMNKFGVTKVFNVDESSLEERIPKVLCSLDTRKGADIVVECTGYPEVVEEGLSYVKPFGTYVIAGIYTDLGRSSTVNVQKLISGKHVTVVGVSGQTNRSYKTALDIMEKLASKLPFEEIVTHTFPIGKVDDAMQTALKEESMKVVIDPQKI